MSTNIITNHGSTLLKMLSKTVRKIQLAQVLISIAAFVMQPSSWRCYLI
jgi:hypothetical protein